jgi:hypothetical protein
MNSFSIPALTALKSTDAAVIRQVVSSLVMEIDKLNKRIDGMEAASKKSRDSRKEKHYGV